MVVDSSFFFFLLGCYLNGGKKNKVEGKFGERECVG